jgi:hypothetical protein
MMRGTADMRRIPASLDKSTMDSFKIMCDINRDAAEAVNLLDESCISLSAQELTNRVTALARHQDRIANHAQGLVTREELEAVEAKLARLESMVAALMLSRAA